MGATTPASDVHKRMRMWHVNDFDNSVLIDFIKYRRGKGMICRTDLLREATRREAPSRVKDHRVAVFASCLGAYRDGSSDVISPVPWCVQ